MSEPKRQDIESRHVRVGQILSDLHDRRARGEPIDEAEILAEHPDLADDIRRYLSVLGELRCSNENIDGLIAQGVLTESDDPEYRANLGAYKTIEFIGRGGMGIVLKAYEESLNRTVALKILRPELVDDKDALKRFTREARAAGTLRHPNIVTVYAVGEEQGVHFLAMEYIEGPTLENVIRQTAKPQPKSPRPWSGGTHRTDDSSSTPVAQINSLSTSAGSRIPSRSSLSTDLIRDVFRQLLSGLTAAQEAGLIHRDIKPANLLLDGWHQSRLGSSRSGPTRPGSDSSFILQPSSFQLKIADFGLALMMNAQTRITIAESMLGTAEYMSPEQVRGDKDLDHHTDLYSAGVVLYEMLTGRTPFSGGSPSTVIHRILNDEPADPKTIRKDADPHLASLALRLMAKRPEDRFASAAEAMEALEAGERVTSLARRRRMRRHVLLGLVALVSIAGAAWFLSRFTARPPIVRVWVDDTSKTTILARYGDDPKPWMFHQFPAEAGGVQAVVLADLDGRGDKLVVAGVQRPVDGHNLFAFDAQRKMKWRRRLSSDVKWPDCRQATELGCIYLARADLDGTAGHELVVVATDITEYPTCITVIDPRTSAVRSTFWHLGQIAQLLLRPDFLGPGRPAIIAFGVNNKLDGFKDRQDGDPDPLVIWDYVSIIMVLDPQQMAGEHTLEPPRGTHRVNLPAALPNAYAFLDLSQGRAVPDLSAGQEHPRYPEPTEVAHIEYMLITSCPYPKDGECLEVGIVRDGLPGAGAIMALDRNLEPSSAVYPGGETVGRNEDYWRDHWHTIIQNGEYVEE